MADFLFLPLIYYYGMRKYSVWADLKIMISDQLIKVIVILGHYSPEGYFYR